MFKLFNIAIIILGTLIFVACSGEKPKSQENKKGFVHYSINNLKVENPKFKSQHTCGDEIEVSISLLSDTLILSKLEIEVNGLPKGNIDISSLKYILKTSDLPTGTNHIRVKAVYNSGKHKEIKSTQIVLLSDITPETYGYEIVNTFPHDPEAYTQGLFYQEGILYEGTGQYQYSSLRKVNLEKGEVLQSLGLPADKFGEGIAPFGDKIIQLTWQSMTGYVYDIKEFRLIKTFNYSTEGWGLTTDGKKLFMSDGSNVIYFLEGEMLGEIGRIEAYDNEGPVEKLNELEYINGKIYANIYTTDKIAVIDAETGKVEAYLNLKGLLKPEDKHNKIDVLNGIAYDKETDRLFVTGKMWPKLFEIKIKK